MNSSKISPLPAAALPHRSWLFVPGDRPERFSKALSSHADAVVLDLEDSVVDGKREEAISNVDYFLGRHPAGGEIGIWSGLTTGYLVIPRSRTSPAMTVSTES
jgi:hypothetical protein